MASVITVDYLYPPNFDGNLSEDQRQGFKEVCVHMTNTSDGTDETDAVKIDLSTLRLPDGATPTRSAVMSIDYNVIGMSVNIGWDRAPRKTIGVYSDSVGYVDWGRAGGKVDPSDGINDQTGDIILSTSSDDSGDSYDITMWVRLKV